MQLVQLDNITIENPRARPSDPLSFAVTFSALQALPHPLTWKVTYVGSAFSETYDQNLQEFEIEPIKEPSTLTFHVETSPPNLKLVPREELLCITALIMSVSYQGQQFVRVGYYVYHAYLGEGETEGLAFEEVVERIQRRVVGEKPRVTKFQIDWVKKEEIKEGTNGKQEDKEGSAKSGRSNSGANVSERSVSERRREEWGDHSIHTVFLQQAQRQETDHSPLPLN